uniref:Zinc finger protein 804B n=1 Tax=Leptobrachium leishanense TaxID=445787 RepID=A0A8C5QS65_9ANUR
MIKGYVEKGKSIANALEDLKANFYCELCDKQYHKHQEFDNHINSYDHAHKQRLKELKQREFARNVASKSWKDEKKQEKALKRLHQLAELRKQPDCASDDSPAYKTPRLKGPQQTLFSNKDERNEKSTISLLCKGEPVTNNNITDDRKDILFGSKVLNESRCCFVGNQTQLPFSNISNVSNRSGVSFCFSKKALLKLDSSASVFNETPEDVNECSQFPNHKSKQMSVSFAHYAPVEENTAENSLLTDKFNSDKAENVDDCGTESMVTFKDNDTSNNVTKEQIGTEQSDPTEDLKSSELGCTDNKNEEESGDFTKSNISLETSQTNQCQEKCCTLEQNSNKHTVADAILIEQLSQLLSQKKDEPEPSGNSNAELDSCNDTVQFPDEYPKTECKEPLNNSAQTIALSCLNVLSKDGNTNLQWPRELVLFTKTEPSISYACNPLYFDFKCSSKNKITKANERVTKSCEERYQFKNSIEKNASGISIAVENGNDSQSSEAKREKHILKEISEKDYESHSNYSLTKEFTQKTKCNLHENAAQISAHLNASQNVNFKESCHSRKRKRSFHGQLEKRESFSNRVNGEHNSLFKDSYSKSLKSLNPVDITMMDNYKDKDCYSSTRIKYRDGGDDDDMNKSETSLVSDSSGGYSNYSDSETDMSSVSNTRLSLLSPSKNSMSLASIDSNRGSACRERNMRSHKSRLKALKIEDCIKEKHNCDALSESDFLLRGLETNQKHMCRDEKHKTLRKSPKIKSSERSLCSKSERPPRKRCGSIKNGHIPERSQLQQINSYENQSSTDKDYPDFTKERTCTIESKNSVDEEEHLNKIERMETSYKCCSENIVSLTDNSAEITSEEIVKRVILNEKETVISELLLGGHSTKRGEKKITSREYSESCNRKLKNHSQRYFSGQFPQTAPDASVLPNVSASHKGRESFDMAQMPDIRINNGETEASKSYELTVTTNTNNCLLEDIIHVGGECRTLDTDLPVSVGRQSRQLINEVQPFMQNSDPVHFKLNCDLASLRHSSGTDSPETKEEFKRLGLNDLNSKSNPLDGYGKCYYDNTMQDFSVPNIHQKAYHKSTSPPTAQPPITFTPDEVDKYRLLQLQAQQHMQKQLLSKHLKALPNTGPSIFSPAQTIQPVSIPQHPSITTIHHALMQRYAVTTSMHSHVNHLHLPHLNPFPPSQFPPITLSSLTPTLFSPHPTFLAGHPLQLVSTAAIHPAHLTIQAIPHAALVPTIFTPHPNVGVHPTIQLHPFIHPLLQGHDFHIHSGLSQPH